MKKFIAVTICVFFGMSLLYAQPGTANVEFDKYLSEQDEIIQSLSSQNESFLVKLCDTLSVGCKQANGKYCKEYDKFLNTQVNNTLKALVNMDYLLDKQLGFLKERHKNVGRANKKEFAASQERLELALVMFNQRQQIIKDQVKSLQLQYKKLSKSNNFTDFLSNTDKYISALVAEQKTVVSSCLKS